MHQPSLTAVQELIPDPELRARLIENCAVPRHWSASVTKKGFFFCEVAGAFDALFDGPGGKPVEEDVWDQPISAFQDQIDRWCPRCGMCVPLEGRLDKDCIDDITPGNLEALRALGSPRVKAGAYVVIDPAKYDFQVEVRKHWDPLTYNRLWEGKPWEEMDYRLDDLKKD